jgi:hypothetical protein
MAEKVLFTKTKCTQPVYNCIGIAGSIINFPGCLAGNPDDFTDRHITQKILGFFNVIRDSDYFWRIKNLAIFHQNEK